MKKRLLMWNLGAELCMNSENNNKRKSENSLIAANQHTGT